MKMTLAANLSDAATLLRTRTASCRGVPLRAGLSRVNAVSGCVHDGPIHLRKLTYSTGSGGGSVTMPRLTLGQDARLGTTRAEPWGACRLLHFGGLHQCFARVYLLAGAGGTPVSQRVPLLGKEPK